MTHEDVMQMLAETEIPFAYDHFAEGESPDPPFICFLFPGSENFAADDVVYMEFSNLSIELYTDEKDPELEDSVEAVLNAHELFWNKSEVWIESTNNKVKFGLKNCHYAKATLDPDTNAVTFGTPVAIPGAVNLSLDPEGDTEPFYADDMVYYTTVANNGYSGDLEIALIPESFRKDILKETEDANGVLVEDSTVEPEHFALLFEFSGDKKKIRHCMYYCTAARPTIEGKTNEDSKEVQTEKLEITATPLPNGLVKVKTGANTSDAVYNGWYSNVYQTEHAQVSAVLTGITIGSLQLTPAFDAGTTSYTAETVNDEDAVSATAASGTAVTILVNGAAHTSGSDATWESGTNTVTVIASKTGCTSTAYTVTVTKNGQG